MLLSWRDDIAVNSKVVEGHALASGLLASVFGYAEYSARLQDLWASIDKLTKLKELCSDADFTHCVPKHDELLAITTTAHVTAIEHLIMHRLNNEKLVRNGPALARCFGASDELTKDRHLEPLVFPAVFDAISDAIQQNRVL